MCPPAALWEAHLTLSICCHMHVFRQPQEFLLMKDSSLSHTHRLCQALLIYLTALTWKSLPICACHHAALGMSLKSWHCCFHSFPQCSSLITYSQLDVGDTLMFSAGTRRIPGRVTVGWPTQDLPHRCRGKDLRNSREREASRHLLFSFYGITSRSKPFLSDSLHSFRFVWAAAKGQVWVSPGCHCVTLPEQTHLALQMLFWVLAWFLISGTKGECLGEKFPFLSYLLCCGPFFFFVLR